MEVGLLTQVWSPGTGSAEPRSLDRPRYLRPFEGEMLQALPVCMQSPDASARVL